MATSTTEARAATPQGFFYGWWIVAVATLALLVTNGLTIGGLPVFFKPLLTDLQQRGLPADQARSVTAYASSITFWAAGLLVMYVGTLVGRVKLRTLLTIGSVILGSSLLLYSRATAPMHVYAAHLLFGASLAFAGLMTNTVLVSNWFQRLRGTAMGIVITGTSLGAALIPKFAEPLITKYGWRTALLAVSGLVWFVLLPGIWLLVRERPQERGLWPDGAAAPASAAADPAKLPGLTLPEALRTRAFWVFALCAAMLFYSILVVVQQITLYLQSPQIGMSLKEAATGQAYMGLASIVGKLLFGWLSDKMSRQRAFLICVTWLFAATLLLLNFSAGVAYAFLIAFGIGFGGAYVVIQVLAVERFGLREAGKILGAITVGETLGGATGLAITGVLARQYDFSVAFYGVIAAAAIALLAGLLMNRQAAAPIR